MNDNTEAGQKLLEGLCALSVDVGRWIDENGEDGWRVGAKQKILDNLALYRSQIAFALEVGSQSKLKQAACGASYLRKGISDTGLFERPRDEVLLARVHDVSTTADLICLSD